MNSYAVSIKIIDAPQGDIQIYYVEANTVIEAKAIASSNLRDQFPSDYSKGFMITDCSIDGG